MGTAVLERRGISPGTDVSAKFRNEPGAAVISLATTEVAFLEKGQ